MKQTTVLLALIALGFGAFCSTPAIATTAEETILLQEKNKEASYPGGKEGLQNFLDENLRYPKDAKRYGKVIVEFTVKKNGKCTDFTVVKSVIDELDYSAIETLQGMPRWEPAIKNGKEVDSKVKVPVYFKPDEDADQKKEESKG
ncbi:MAG: energy transducer TonB [Vicingaceae bacterium]